MCYWYIDLMIDDIIQMKENSDYNKKFLPPEGITTF
jgi:hypothetical protein